MSQPEQEKTRLVVEIDNDVFALASQGRAAIINVDNTDFAILLAADFQQILTQAAIQSVTVEPAQH
jgi:hypothetical protein